MAVARIQNTVLAESNETIYVEGNHYFPPQSLKKDHFSPSDTQTYCPWKGHAAYFHVEADGQKYPDLAWYYPTPYEKAEGLKDYVAFYGKVEVDTQPEDTVRKLDEQGQAV